MRSLLACASLCTFLSLNAAIAQVAPPTIAARSWLLLDATSGQVLAAHDPDLKVEPASLTKVLTAYLVFEALKDKRITADQRPAVSPRAHKAIGSRMFVDPARPATVEELMNGMIVQSGNDASIVLAEAIAGSEDTFAQQMNQEAQRLGMRNSQFRNATGLPDPQHYSTAHDMAILAARLIEDFPEYFPLYSRRDYTFNNIRQPNRNRLLAIDPSVDGMKTGHTDAAGYCLIATAHREQPGFKGARRLVSVVMGTNSESARAIESQKLLNFGFQNFDPVRIYAKGQSSGDYAVWKGRADTVAGGFEHEVVVTVPRGQGDKVKAEIERMQPLVAPIAQGQRIGTLRVKLGEQVIAERALLAQAAVEQAGWFGRTWDGLRMMFAR
ncbi:MAG: D-alanyl-D-alanine carboxypeptidase [Burkholderiaceae bacterium]|nr:D-alanyl-D-alanine carboxypeptidase [Burkholderiaceae bacterium]